MSITQIVASYEQAGMTPEEIVLANAEDGLELNAVKAVLYARSLTYRNIVEEAKGQKPAVVDNDLDFSDEDERVANRVVRDLATGAENEAVRLRAAERIKDERKGRLDIRAGLKDTQIGNMLAINEHFARAMSALADKVKPKQLGNPIDV